jgi:exonuclease III
LRTFQLHVLDTIYDNYVSIGQSSDEGNPAAITCNYRSGVAFLIAKDIYPFVSVIEVDSNRITGIELSIPGRESYFIFSLCRPAITQSSDSFRDHIDLLSELVSVYNEIGTVILMGDFNSKIRGPRYQVTNNVRAKLCSSLMGEHNIFSVSMELFCKGPIVTFQSYDGGPSTCIDHILMNNVKKHTVIHAEVLDNHSFALSDHHPVLCTLILELLSRHGLLKIMNSRFHGTKHTEHIKH